jgi:hypothetical protein
MGLFQDPEADRPCRLCEHWGGDVPDSENAFCARDGNPRTQANKHRGCVFWVKAIGLDQAAIAPAETRTFEEMFPDEDDTD